MPNMTVVRTDNLIAFTANVAVATGALFLLISGMLLGTTSPLSLIQVAVILFDGYIALKIWNNNMAHTKGDE